MHAKFSWHEKNVKTTSLTCGKGWRTKITPFQIHSRVYIFFKTYREKHVLVRIIV